MALLTWMRRRTKRCWRPCCSLCGVLVLIIVLGCYYLYTENTCSPTQSKQLIKDLCDLYHRGNVTGSMCRSLCDTHKLVYNACTNYRQGKKVLFMKCDDCEGRDRGPVTVVLKTKTELEKRERLQHLGFKPETATDVEVRDVVEMVETMIKGNALNEFGVNLSSTEDLISYAWGWNFNDYVKSYKQSEKYRAVLVGLESLYSLTDQSEYMLLRYLQDKQIVPQIYGTCGPAYFVEYTESLSKYDFSFFPGHATGWKERAKIAVRLIQLMRQLETDFHQPLHLCDVKPDNFGVRQSGEITLIDIDCAMFGDKLLGQFSFTNCSSHDDCDFFDCRGFCNKTSGRCLLSRTNNNMQSLCEDLFIGYVPKVPSGLLRDAPLSVKVDLYSVLDQCAYPGKDTARHSVRDPASPSAIAKLEYLLEKSLKEL